MGQLPDSAQLRITTAIGNYEACSRLKNFADMRLEAEVTPSSKTFNIARQVYLSAIVVLVASGKIESAYDYGEVASND